MRSNSALASLHNVSRTGPKGKKSGRHDLVSRLWKKWLLQVTKVVPAYEFLGQNSYFWPIKNFFKQFWEGASRNLAKNWTPLQCRGFGLRQQDFRCLLWPSSHDFTRNTIPQNRVWRVLSSCANTFQISSDVNVLFLSYHCQEGMRLILYNLFYQCSDICMWKYNWEILGYPLVSIEIHFQPI